jgi:hypothetical protein
VPAGVEVVTEGVYYTDFWCVVCNRSRPRTTPAYIVTTSTGNKVRCAEHGEPDDEEEDERCGCHCHNYDFCEECGKAGVKHLPATVNVQAAIEGNGLRVEVTQGMRAPVVEGQVTLKTCWRADLFHQPDRTDRLTQRPKWTPLITVVDDTPAGLFQQLASLAIEGEVRIHD